MVTIKKETPSEGLTSSSTRVQQSPTPHPPQYTFQHQFQVSPVSQDYEHQLKLLEEQNAKRLRMARAEKKASSMHTTIPQQQIKIENQNPSPMPPSTTKANGWVAWPDPSFSVPDSIKLVPSGNSPSFSTSSSSKVPASGLASDLHLGHSLQDYQTQLQLLKMQNELRNQKKDHDVVEITGFQPSRGPPDSSPHHLQEYQIQLKLLRQQDAKRQRMILQKKRNTEALKKAWSSQISSSPVLNNIDDQIHAKFMASGNIAAARDYTMQLGLLRQQIHRRQAMETFTVHSENLGHYATQLKTLDNQIQKNQHAEALKNSDPSVISDLDTLFAPCATTLASLRDSGSHHAAQSYEMQLMMLKQQVQNRKTMEALERQRAGDSCSLETPRNDDPKMSRPKGRDIVEDAEDLICIKAELAFIRNCILRLHQNRQAILALEKNNMTFNPTQILETQDGPHSFLTQQIREKEDEIIKNHFISRGSEPPKDLFELCPEKWDEDTYAMEALINSFEDLWEDWEDENFRRGEDMLYSIKDCVRNYYYPEDHCLHPPLEPIHRLGQEVGKKMAKFITTQVPLEREEGVTILEFCKRYFVPGASWLDDTIYRELESARALGRNREWLGRQVNLQLEEREKGREVHFCKRGKSDLEDGESVWSREGTVDSGCSRLNTSFEENREGTAESEWSGIGSPSGSTREGTVDSEWSRLDTPTGSTREGTIDSEWSRLDTPMEGMEGIENGGEGFQHVLPIRSVNMTG